MLQQGLVRATTSTRALDTLSATAQLVGTAATSRISPADRAWRAYQASFYDELWSGAAADVGATVSRLHDGTLELSRGDRVARFRGSNTFLESPEALERSADKDHVARVLSEAGLPVPAHQVFTLSSLGSALGFAEGNPGPYVVKPAAYTSAGKGVTTNVRSWRDLRRAAASAAAAGGRAARTSDGTMLQRVRSKVIGIATVPLLLQRQMAGVNYRLLYHDGVLIDALRRKAPAVVGDGLHTVGELIERVNEVLRQRDEPVVHRDLDLEQTIAAQGLSWSTVPVSGRPVDVKTKINENARTDNFSAFHEVGVGLVAEGRRAAELLGVRLAGVDVLTTDPAVPLTESGGCILEVNSTPGLAIHYHGHPGEVRVATIIVGQLLDPPSQQRTS